MPHGKGVAKYQDDNGICEGTFNHGVLEGDASQSFANGDTFKGTIKRNEYEEGEYIWKEGEKYKGTFKNEKPYSGTYYNVSGNIEGVYDKGKYKVAK